MIEGVSIRLAEESEHAELVDLLRRSALTVEADREALLANIETITFPLELIHQKRVFVAVLNGPTVGFAAVSTNEFLEKLFIEPEFMGQGIGRLLVERCVEFVREQGVPTLRVIANPFAEGFYTSCRFQTVGDYETRFGTALLMEREL